MMQEDSIPVRVTTESEMPVTDPVLAMQQKTSVSRTQLRPPLSPARRAAVAAVMALFGLLIAGTFAIPMLIGLRAAQSERAAAVAELEHERRVAAAYDDLRVQLGRHAGAVTRAAAALPISRAEGETDVPQLLALVASLTEAGTTGIFLDSVDVSGLQHDETYPGELRYRTITLHGLSGTGSLERLLDAFRSTLRLIDPEQMEFAYAGEGIVSFTLVLRAYALGAEETL
jgi:hypothetical protein